MKAVIPVAGIGSRLKPHTQTQPKSLIPVAGKPILGHIMDHLVDAGVTEFVFIIGYLGDRIEQFLTEHYKKYHLQFVIQTVGRGIGHAVWLAKEHFEGPEPILIVLGDTIFDADLKTVFASETSLLGVKKVDDPRLFGVAELEPDGRIRKLVEKPNIPHSNLALVGLYFIKETATLFECLEYNITHDVKHRNEFNLTDALFCMIEKGIRMETFPVNSWFDCGKREIILQTNKQLLKAREQGDHKMWRDKGNIIVPPVYIAPTAHIEYSIIGPDVSIGDDAHITRSIISNSIIGLGASLNNVTIENSLIGSDATLSGAVHSLNIGDSAEIHL
jgi:glucose-1-phosphate thymidylyltransferase